MKTHYANPWLRTPLALIIDDSAPCINLAYYWIRDRIAWKARHHPGVPPDPWEGDPQKVESLPRAIPADFARKFGEWCLEEGVKGKFSLIPFPAAVGRVDQHLPGHSDRELAAWLQVAHEVLQRNYDFTPEMLTHTVVVDLKTWQPTEAWEQVEWVNPVPEDLLTEYIATSLQLLRNVGIVAEGVTSPGGFGGRMEETYARATLTASQQVNGYALPFYFKHIYTDRLPDVPVRYPNRAAGEAVVSIIACTGDWFGGWTGYDLGSPDLFITEDLQGGRLPEVIAAEAPCILCGHWPGFYYGGEESGFAILKEVKRRLDRLDPDGERTVWLKTSEIARHFAAAELSQVTIAGGTDPGQVRLEIDCPVDCPTWTLWVEDFPAAAVQVGEQPLRQARSRRDFGPGSFLVEGNHTAIALDLQAGVTALVCRRGDPVGHP